MLWQQPTPLERHDNLASQLGLEALYVKRDDCNGPGFGGNKVRQLEYYLGDALAKGADTVLMTGAVQSNFVRTASAACAMLGLRCHVQLEDRVDNKTDDYRHSGNVLLDHLFGAEVHSYPEGEDEEGADRQLQIIADDLSKAGATPYIVHMHPDRPPLGALGYLDCASELVTQIDTLNIPFDAIFAPSGSGNTHGGLLYGLRRQSSEIPVHGICVRRDRSAQLPRLVRRCQQISELLEEANPTTPEDVLLNDDFLAPGYGLAGDQTMEAISIGARFGGLVLDPVYTGKTFAGLIEYASKNKGARAILIHTGGGPSIFGYRPLMEKIARKR